MIIVYRDAAGLVAVETHPDYNIAFLGEVVHFTDAGNEEHRIPVAALVCIDTKREGF